MQLNVHLAHHEFQGVVRGELFEKLELREADLLDNESLERAIEGATYLVHVASPFYM